jgi:hypothetical protein
MEELSATCQGPVVAKDGHSLSSSLSPLLFLIGRDCRGPRRVNSRPPAGSWLYQVLGFVGGYADAAGFGLVSCDEIPSINGRDATNPYTRTLRGEES